MSDHCGDDDDSLGSVDSNDTTMRTIQFQSLRDDNKLEQGISLVWPTDPESRTLALSTLLEPDDLAPLFAGAQWAGTRVWHAAIHGMFYMEKEYGTEMATGASLLELGCGLGVPGMIWHMLGGNTVLSDQESIMSQLHANLRTNFPDTTKTMGGGEGVKEGGATKTAKGPSHTISAHPLSWSRDGVHKLSNDSGYTNGFDYVLNCDCVYEPLYGKSWELLVEVIDELLKINPKCVVVSSVERRRADGIDGFVQRMKSCEHVGSVVQVLRDDKLQLEIYVTTGKQ
uniref:Calmodulin-lysine N-methyltransferase n=1 Tax=Minutocellus polymorphus TaxID=265543 RepID=A0A7S0AG38_9STRA